MTEPERCYWSVVSHDTSPNLATCSFLILKPLYNGLTFNPGKKAEHAERIMFEEGKV